MYEMYVSMCEPDLCTLLHTICMCQCVSQQTSVSRQSHTDMRKSSTPLVFNIKEQIRMCNITHLHPSVYIQLHCTFLSELYNI
jgi:hypothetical protein